MIILSASERRRKLGMIECSSSPENEGAALLQAAILPRGMFSLMQSPWMALDVILL